MDRKPEKKPDNPFKKLQIVSYEKSLEQVTKYLGPGENIIAETWGFAINGTKPVLLALTESRLIRYRKKFIGEEMISLPISGITTIDESSKLGSRRIDFYNINGMVSFYPSLKPADKEKTKKLMDLVKSRINSEKPVEKIIEPQIDAPDQIRKFAKLRDEKIITEEEFQKKKRELLSS